VARSIFNLLPLLQIFKSDLGARAKADRCVSLVSKQYGELNLEAGSKMQLTAWLFGVRATFHCPLFCMQIALANFRDICPYADRAAFYCPLFAVIFCKQIALARFIDNSHTFQINTLLNAHGKKTVLSQEGGGRHFIVLVRFCTHSRPPHFSLL
jgi:hypothetical protein